MKYILRYYAMYATVMTLVTLSGIVSNADQM